MYISYIEGALDRKKTKNSDKLHYSSCFYIKQKDPRAKRVSLVTF